jgi:hypothetical protein
MITHGEVDKLRSIRAPENSVLSLYVTVPRDPADLRELRARAGDLVQAAAAESGARLPAGDEQVARDAVVSQARQWLGHTLAVFVCGDLGLLEVVVLPGEVAERAVLAVRPHLRPLLAMLQRHPDHRIVIIDRDHVWLLAVSGERTQTIAGSAAQSGPGAGSGGWHGLESHGAGRVVAGLARLHYRDAAAVLARMRLEAGAQPLIIGGHAESIKHLLTALPNEVREDYVGCFAADPHVLTAASARDLAAPVIARWNEQRERQLVQDVAAPDSGIRAAVGLHACLAAVNAEEQDLLLIPDAGMVPGYVCERCGLLTLTVDGCCDWGAASRPDPDLLEEMALRTLHADGDVISVRELPCGVAARLR